jgi:hypothetical protein
MNEMPWPAGVRNRSSSSHGEMAMAPKASAMNVCPMNFARLRSPRLRWRAILM